MDFALVVLAYGIGSIPFSILVARSRGVDLRTVGSGNPGATNVARALGMRWGIVVLLLDAAKGFVPTWWFPGLATGTFGSHAWIIVLVAGATIVGHVFPITLGFRGGKGAATGLGACLAMVPGPTGIAAAAFAIVVLVTRYVSLGSIVGAVSLPIAFAVLAPAHSTGDGLPILVGLVALAALIVARHRANLARIFAGTESKLGRKAGSA